MVGTELSLLRSNTILYKLKELQTASKSKTNFVFILISFAFLLSNSLTRCKYEYIYLNAYVNKCKYFM